LKKSANKPERFAADVGRGMRRAQRIAREVACMHRTPIIFWENGKVVAKKLEVSTAGADRGALRSTRACCDQGVTNSDLVCLGLCLGLSGKGIGYVAFADKGLNVA
jgi:hypothetical protein